MPAASPTAESRLGPFAAAVDAVATTHGATARGDAAGRALAAPWPTTAEEIWRYSRIDELDLTQFAIGELHTEITGGAGLVSTDAGVGPLVVDDDADVFAELNAALADPVVVRIPAGTVVAEPIVVTHRVDETGTAVFPRLLIEAGDDSEVVVVERFRGAAGSLTVPVVQVAAGRAARVKYLVVEEVDDAAWLIGQQQTAGDADSDVSLHTVALGGAYARFRAEARVTGKGANTRQAALYLAAGTQMHDFRTTQDHDAPRTTSNLLFKGVVQDNSLSVYTGLIKVRPHARGTVAFQTNRNLTLGEGAWAESVPNLDIKTNDVSCSHASTVGPVDPEHRFYLESRGLPTAVADRLIVIGFFDEVLDQLPVRAVADEVRAAIIAKLDLEQVAAASDEAVATTADGAS